MEGKVAELSTHVADLPMPTRSATFSWSERGVKRAAKPRHRLVKRCYVATFGPSEHLGSLAEAAAQRVRQGPPPHVIVLADGAKWITTEQGRHFPQATCILDWAHLWREVSHAIRVAARAKSLSQREQQDQLSLHQSWLWQGGVDQAVHGLRALGADLPTEAQEAIK